MSLILGVLLAIAPASTAASGHNKSCIAAADLLSPALFRQHPAIAWHGHNHAPDVRSGVAHQYRTVLRSEAAAPPDFAGHYRVVKIGCGAGAICPLLLDLQTGKVVQIPSLKIVDWDDDIATDNLMRATGMDDPRLRYRRDSRLLVAVGNRNEDNRFDGVAIYFQEKGAIRLIRFVPKSALCREGDES